jgi:cyclopropane fatty-acyl-phospholipid synthase-like methyltransferase
MNTAAHEYGSYVEFKGWRDGNGADPEEFEALLGLSAATRGYAHLDIGFGRGDFLDWSRTNRAARTFGTELIPELRESAAHRGHVVLDPDLELCERRFDVITAVDVLEHLSLDQCRDLLRQVRRLLEPHGVFIARFPNGQSPFSGRYQNGDLTHVRALTGESIRQIAEPEGLTLRRELSLRPHMAGLRGLKRRVAYLVRDLIEVVIGYAYLGHRIAMDANLVVVLARS